MTGRRRLLLSCAAAALSGLLLAAAFPPMDRGEMAWFALVPLILAVRNSRPLPSLGLGFLAGLVFWTLNLAWLESLSDNGVGKIPSIAAWLILAAYSAVYFAVFAMLAARWFQSFGSSGTVANLCFMVAAPFAWIGLEYIRAGILTGFPWNPLGVSQHSMLPLIQAAEYGGVYAVSALLVVLNSAIALTILNFRGRTASRQYRIHFELLAGLVTLAVALSFGMRRIAEIDRENGPSAGICVAQPAIPQTEKWTIELVDRILGNLSNLVESASAAKPDLIVLPETSMPGDALNYPDCAATVAAMLSNGCPVLLGSTDTRGAGDDYSYYNCSMLFEPPGGRPVIYDKQHLAPFGEYDPTGLLPMRSLAPEGWCALTPGSKPVIFRLAGNPAAVFAALICFEDSFPSLARLAMLRGARFLVNQTNDAWFDGSCGARQHMAQYIFRCVENRVPGVRSANTGISCFIDRAGRVTHELRDPLTGGHASRLFWTADIKLPPAGAGPTFYTRHGDVAPAAAAAAAAVLFVLVLAESIRIHLRERKAIHHE